MVDSVKIAGVCPLRAEMRGAPDAPCIVLVQGLGMAVADWPPALLEQLARDFYVVCIENRDAGRSARCGPDFDRAAIEMLEGRSGEEPAPYTLFDMRDDVLRCVDHLNIERFALLGFSMGGMISQLVAANAGARVSSLIQICSSAGEAELPTSTSSWNRILRTARPFDCKGDLIDWLAEDLMWWSSPAEMPRAEAESTAKAMIAGGFTQGGYARQLLALSRSGDRQTIVASISVPTLIIAGMQDRCIPPESSRQAHRLIENSQLALIEGMGHAIEKPAIDNVKRWLGGLSADQPDFHSNSACGGA